MPMAPTFVIAETPLIVWLGGVAGDELRYAREGIDGLATVVEVDDPDGAATIAAGGRSPAALLLASPTPARWSLADIVAVSRTWPLSPLVSVAASLVEGRRRSGPPLPGIEEVAWCDLQGRLTWWLADRAAGRPGTLGMPATARREERLVESLRGPTRRRLNPAGRVWVCARSPVDLDGLGDLVAAAGSPACGRSLGRPAIDVAADVIVWDWGHPEPARLAWLRMLAAERPSRRVVVLESFPRADTARAAARAGAVAVLSRPTAVETLAGTLWGLLGAAATGLGCTPTAG